MPRTRNRSRGSTVRLARPTTALDHTASRYRDPLQGLLADDYPPESGGFFDSPVRPLIRTVLEIPSTPYQAPPRRGKRASPTVAVRATFRSTDKAVRSPFLNATAITPQLTERAILCAKRNIRREVIFATKATGRGSKAPRRFRSKVKC